MALKKRSRWTGRLLAALPGLGLAGVLGASAFSVCGMAHPVLSQETADSSGVVRTYLNKPLIHLPIEIDGGYRSQITSLVLYAKEGQNGAWSIRDKATPMQTSFTFRAPHEGEYWFRIVAIDNQGKSHPDDLAKDPQDAVVVVVDATLPTLDVIYRGAVPEGQIIQCDVRDVNPDLLKTRFQYQTRDETWRNLESMPDQPLLFCVPAQAALTNFIRVMAVDLAGNSTLRTFNLSELAAAAKNVARTNPPPATPIPAALPQTVAQSPTAPLVLAASDSAPNSAPKQPAPFPVDPSRVGDANPPHPINQSPRANLPVQAPPAVSGYSPTLESPTAAKTTEMSPEIETASFSRQPAPAQPAPANIQIVGSPQVYLNYVVDQVGASGVGKMEIYASRDRGQSWQKVAEEKQLKNPAEAVLPGEGVFGLKLVASNGRGFGAQSPRPGEASDWWVEVDTTEPRVEITGLSPGTGPESGSLHIYWKAEDKNLAPDTAELFYAASREGPWAPIAKNLKTSGQHRWMPPQEFGPHAYIRVLVRDKAGNIGLAETLQPQPLDDQSRPRVRLLGVTASPTLHPSSAANRIIPVETTNTPVDGRVPRILPGNQPPLPAIQPASTTRGELR